MDQTKMSKSEFTTDEQFLVNSVKSARAADSSPTYMWGYVS